MSVFYYIELDNNKNIPLNITITSFDLILIQMLIYN